MFNSFWGWWFRLASRKIHSESGGKCLLTPICWNSLGPLSKVYKSSIFKDLSKLNLVSVFFHRKMLQMKRAQDFYFHSAHFQMHVQSCYASQVIHMVFWWYSSIKNRKLLCTTFYSSWGHTDWNLCGIWNHKYWQIWRGKT